MDTDKRRMFFDKADLISSSLIYPFLIRVYLWLFLPVYFAQLLKCRQPNHFVSLGVLHQSDFAFFAEKAARRRLPEILRFPQMTE